MTTEQKEETTETERQIVVLHLGEELYGVDIAAIYTVITPHAITPVPRTPDFIAGVMNLRGRIVPVIDLRRRFGLPATEGQGRRIVIVDVEGLTAGLIVDDVTEVLRLPDAAVDAPSRLVASAESDCILGVGRIPAAGEGEERLIILLDVYRTLVTDAGGGGRAARPASGGLKEDDMNPIRVLVVDDSALMRRMVTEIVAGADGMEVAGQARDGAEALQQLEALRPDVVTLDVQMPVMDGLAALAEIMRRRPTPVVMLLSLTQAGADTTLRCLEQGAVDFVGKPGGPFP